jgi:TolA-binding protein
VTQQTSFADDRLTWWPRVRRACLLGAFLALPMTGHAQIESREGIALQNQIYQLRQDLQILRSEATRGDNGGGGGGDIAAQLLSRVQALEEQSRQLRGRIDETQNLINRQNAELSKRIDDLTFQLNLQGKGGGSSLPAAVAPPPVREVPPRTDPPPPRTVDTPPRPDFTPRLAMPGPLPTVIPPPPPAPPQSFTFNQTPEPMRETPPPPRIEPAKPPPPRPADVAMNRPPPSPPPPPVDTGPPPAPATLSPDGKRTPELALQEGNAALARRDYAAAERSAREVMANRISPRAYDGQFLLARSLEGEKQFAQAAIAFDDAYNRSHKGRYAQEALVGLAGALTSINEKKAACDTLGRLRAEFPQVRADLRDSITKTNQRAGCAG